MILTHTAIRALPDLCLRIVSGRLESLWTFCPFCLAPASPPGPSFTSLCIGRLTSNQIAERLGATAGNISSCLSKLAAYGIIGKTRYRRGPRGNVYRALTDEQAAT